MFSIVVADGGLNLRKEPDIKSERVALLPDNALVTVLEPDTEAGNAQGESGTWRMVEFRGNRGWVSSQYLSAASDKNCFAAHTLEQKFNVNLQCGTEQRSLLQNALAVYRALPEADPHPPTSPRIEILNSEFAIVSRPVRDATDGRIFPIQDLWYLTSGLWSPATTARPPERQRAELFDINSDGLLDAIVENYCCGQVLIRVYLQKKNDHPIMAFSGIYSGAVIKKGSCQNFRMELDTPMEKGWPLNKNIEHYHYDCSQAKMIRVAAGIFR